MKAMTYIVDRHGNRFPMFEADAEQVAKWWDEMYPRKAPHVVVGGRGGTKGHECLNPPS